MMVTDEEATRRVLAQGAEIDAKKERATVASIIAWLRSPDMDGHCHTHSIAKELERGDWQEWRDAETDSESKEKET